MFRPCHTVFYMGVTGIMPKLECFASRLSQLRSERQMSQTQLAARLQITQGLLSHYENGRREPGLAFIVQVCQFFDISADYLLGLSDTPRTLSEPGREEILHKVAKELESTAGQLSGLAKELIK